MTYDEAMEELGSAVADAFLAARKAVKAADNEDGAPVEDVKDVCDKLECLDRDIDTLISHRVTYAELKQLERLYHGAKLAGIAK